MFEPTDIDKHPDELVRRILKFTVEYTAGLDYEDTVYLHELCDLFKSIAGRILTIEQRLDKLESK